MPGGLHQPATWTAGAAGASGYYGGIPGYTIQWFKSCDGGAAASFGPQCEGGWEIISNGATAQEYVDFGDDDFQIKLEITDSESDFDSDISFIQVDNCYSGPQQQTTASKQTADTPATFSLAENYPNPFNPQTEIRFTLPKATDVRLVVYDVLGRAVETLVDEPMEAGKHTVTFDAKKQPSGTYLYRLTAGNFTDTRRMVLLR